MSELVSGRLLLQQPEDCARAARAPKRAVASLPRHERRQRLLELAARRDGGGGLRVCSPLQHRKAAPAHGCVAARVLLAGARVLLAGARAGYAARTSYEVQASLYARGGCAHVQLVDAWAGSRARACSRGGIYIYALVWR